MAAQERAPVLVLCDSDRTEAVAPLCGELRDTGRYRVDMTTDPGRLLHLDGVAVLYAHSSRHALSVEQARAVARFAHNGGAVVAVGETLQRWSACDAIADAAGWSPNGETVRSELDVRRADGSERFRVADLFNLLPAAPAGAAPLLVTNWHYSDQVLAYRRPVGGGSFTYVGLGHDPEVYGNDEARRALRRLIQEPLPSSSQPLGVGLLGFGALGASHATALGSVDGLKLAAICDRDAARRRAARRFGVPVIGSDAELLRLDGVDVVLIATPPVTHADVTLQALEAGRHVVCEKPFALRTSDCDRAMACAERHGLTLTVFQNRRWDPDFVMLRRVVASGGIGEVFHVETFVGGHAHPCHMWHSHEPISGGAMYDWGSHYVDWILQLVDRPVVAVRGQDAKRVWHDVTNADHATVDLRFDDGATASFTQSDIAAAAKPKWYVLGTAGAIVGDWQHATRRRRGPDGELDEERVRPTDLPARLSVHRPDGSGGTHVETLALPARDRTAFHRNLAGHLLRGDALAVPAAQARRVVAVLEAATESAARHGEIIERRI